MRIWNLQAGDPLMLTIAADARLSPTDYGNDQIWQLSLGGGDPPALALQTTFGLRARAFRMFPRLIENDVAITDPAEFVRAPALQAFFPNYLAVNFSPFPDIDVLAEYWVPDSHAVSGRLRLHNHSRQARQVRLEWVVQLTPVEGQRMAPLEMQAALVLGGATGDLAPVVFVTGGPQLSTGPYPSLALELELPPNSERVASWVEAALDSAENSFNHTRSLAARPWDAEIARLELVNAAQVEVYTGNADWDAAFALSQKTALGLFLQTSGGLPHPSFVINRQPDQGHSLRGDGSDYNHLWCGQTPLESLYLAGLVLPGHPQLAKGLLRNFLSTEELSGFIDWKPGPSGQRSHALATPVLATLAWRIYQETGDQAFLAEVFDDLLNFLVAWFRPEHDRDRDGIPEWDHTMQTGADDHPQYSRWQEGSLMAEISTVETVSLCSFLYRECQTLLEIAALLGRSEPAPMLQDLSGRMRHAVLQAWDSQNHCYYDWDRDTHNSVHGQRLGERQGPGKLFIQQTFEQPLRLLVQVISSGESTRRPQIQITGRPVEIATVSAEEDSRLFKWYLGRGGYTSQKVYSYLESIEILGLDPDDRVLVYSLGQRYLNQSQLLPLWAGIPDFEQAQQLVEAQLTNPDGFWRRYGIPSCADTTPADEASSACHNTSLIWNALIGEGLLEYGYRETAAELLTRLMNAVVATTKREAAFRHSYHADLGSGMGEKNSINGLAPLALFLSILGVRLISANQVAFNGFNPFPWPVTIKYRGLTILCQKDKHIVIFTDGQTIIVDDPSSQLVSFQVQPV